MYKYLYEAIIANLLVWQLWYVCTCFMDSFLQFEHWIQSSSWDSRHKAQNIISWMCSSKRLCLSILLFFVSLLIFGSTLLWLFFLFLHVFLPIWGRLESLDRHHAKLIYSSPCTPPKLSITDIGIASYAIVHTAVVHAHNVVFVVLVDWLDCVRKN